MCKPINAFGLLTFLLAYFCWENPLILAYIIDNPKRWRPMEGSHDEGPWRQRRGF